MMVLCEKNKIRKEEEIKEGKTKEKEKITCFATHLDNYYNYYDNTLFIQSITNINHMKRRNQRLTLSRIPPK